MHSHHPLLSSFLRQNSLDLTMESDAQTLLALHCLKGTNNTAKSNHVSSSFLISYVLFHVYFSTYTNLLISMSAIFGSSKYWVQSLQTNVNFSILQAFTCKHVFWRVTIVQIGVLFVYTESSQLMHLKQVFCEFIAQLFFFKCTV